MITSKVVKNYGILGLDASKGSSHVCVTTSAGMKLTKVKRYAHTRSSLSQLVDHLNVLKDKHKLSGFKLGFEPTGPYSRCVVDYLTKAGLDPVQVNPFHSHSLSIVLDNTRNKTDKKDPLVIAMLVQINKGISLRQRHNKKRETVRDLLHYRERLVKEKARVLNQLESATTQVFPEYYSIMKGFRSKTSLFLLKFYQCDPQKIGKLTPSRLGERFRKMSYGQLNIERARVLIHAARQTIGLPGHFVFNLEIKELNTRLERFKSHLEEVEKKIEEQLKHFEETDYLKSIKGFGLICMANICCEIGAWHNYRNAASVEKAIGLNLFERSSGKQIGQRKISKMGSSILRRILYFFTLRTIKQNGIFYKLYKHHLSKSMKKKQAVIAITRKLIRIIYAMVTNKQHFDQNQIDQLYKQLKITTN